MIILISIVLIVSWFMYMALKPSGGNSQISIGGSGISLRNKNGHITINGSAKSLKVNGKKIF